MIIWRNFLACIPGDLAKNFNSPLFLIGGFIFSSFIKRTDIYITDRSIRTRAIGQHGRESTGCTEKEVLEQRTRPYSVRVLEFSRGLSGQIDRWLLTQSSYQHNPSHRLFLSPPRWYPYVIFSPNSHKHVEPSQKRKGVGEIAEGRIDGTGSNRGTRSSRYYLSELSTFQSVMPTYA